MAQTTKNNNKSGPNNWGKQQKQPEQRKTITKVAQTTKNNKKVAQTTGENNKSSLNNEKQ